MVSPAMENSDYTNILVYGKDADLWDVLWLTTTHN